MRSVPKKKEKGNRPDKNAYLKEDTSVVWFADVLTMFAGKATGELLLLLKVDIASHLTVMAFAKIKVFSNLSVTFSWI